MKRLLPIIIIVISILAGSAISVQAQRKAERTSSGRAAYGNVSEFKANKKRNQKAKKKALKSAKRKKAGNNRSSYFRARPY